MPRRGWSGGVRAARMHAEMASSFLFAVIDGVVKSRWASCVLVLQNRSLKFVRILQAVDIPNSIPYCFVKISLLGGGDVSNPTERYS
jgi:hypothetical protein